MKISNLPRNHVFIWSPKDSSSFFKDIIFFVNVGHHVFYMATGLHGDFYWNMVPKSGDSVKFNGKVLNFNSDLHLYFDPEAVVAATGYRPSELIHANAVPAKSGKYNRKFSRLLIKSFSIFDDGKVKSLNAGDQIKVKGQVSKLAFLTTELAFFTQNPSKSLLSVPIAEIGFISKNKDENTKIESSPQQEKPEAKKPLLTWSSLLHKLPVLRSVSHFPLGRNSTMNLSSTLKKVLLGSAAVLGLGTALFGFDFVSYLGVAGHQVREAARSQIPVTVEIERAKEMLASLEGEERSNLDVMAREEVEINRIEKTKAALKERMEEAKEEIKILTNDLASQPDASHFSYNGRRYTRLQVESDLSSRFERYQVDEAHLKSLEDMLTVRRSKLATAKERQTAYLSEQRSLRVKIEELVARHSLIELNKITDTSNFNDDALGKVKGLVADIDARLEVDERLLGSTTDLANEVKLSEDKVQAVSITERVARHFAPENVDANSGAKLVSDQK